MFFLLFNYLPTDSAIEPFILSGSGTLRLGDEKIIIKEKEYALLEFQFHTKNRTNMAIRWCYENFLTIFKENLCIIDF